MSHSRIHILAPAPVLYVRRDEGTNQTFLEIADRGAGAPEAALTISVATHEWDADIFANPIRLAEQLERAAAQLRALVPAEVVA